MPKATHRLRIRRLDTVGFVDKGDDPKAMITFWKRDHGAETFDEIGSQEHINGEIWDLTHRIGQALRSALEESEDDQSPLDLINTSLDQFMMTVRARAPMWVQGKPVEKTIIERGEKFLVMSSDGTRVLGTHDTREEAETQLAAVEANTNKRPIMDRVMAALRKLGLRSDVPKEDIEKLLAPGAPGSDNKTGSTTGGDMPFDIEKLGDEDRAEFEKLQGQLVEATDKVAALEKAAGKEPDPDDLDTDDLPEPVAKALAAFGKRTKAAEDRAEAAETSVAALVDARENRRFIAKAKELGFVPDDDASMLRKVAGALTEEEFGKFETKILALRKQADEGGLYGEIGSNGAVTGDEAEGEVVELVKQYRTDNPGTSEELARGVVLKGRLDLRRALESTERSHNRED